MACAVIVGTLILDGHGPHPSALVLSGMPAVSCVIEKDRAASEIELHVFLSWSSHNRLLLSGLETHSRRE